MGSVFFLHLLFFLSWVALFSGERGSSEPLISGDTFRHHADHIFDETTTGFDPAKVKTGDLIFVKTDWEYLEAFFTEYHPHIAHPYILLTHNSDHSAPGPFSRYLDDPKILAWFAQNKGEEAHPKLHPVPIGVANRHWGHGSPEVFSSLLSLAKNQNRPYLCYMNFAPSTYPKERPYVWDLFASKPWCAVSDVKSISSYLKDLSRSKFVLSPRGNGLDCHRTWEALLMGAIPIVRSSSLDSLFADLPVLIVENWEVITESYLKEQYKRIKQKTYQLDKLFIGYWLKLIRELSNLEKYYVNMHLGGRLGNQMFQIAAALSFAKDFGAVAVFPDLVYRVSEDLPKNYRYFFGALNVEKPRKEPTYCFEESPHFEFCPIPFHKNIEINGYFQSERYFKHNKEIICDAFKPSLPIQTYLREKYRELLEHPNTVAIHLRAYKLEGLDIEKCFPFLDGSFYMKAAEQFFPEEALFVIFSDQIEWAKEEMKEFHRPHIFIENEPHYHDFYLMSFCKHQIISPSSFSWWAAYLNKNPNKIVVAPDPWFSPVSGHDSSNVIPPEWFKLKWSP